MWSQIPFKAMDLQTQEEHLESYRHGNQLTMEELTSGFKTYGQPTLHPDQGNLPGIAEFQMQDLERGLRYKTVEDKQAKRSKQGHRASP